MSVLTDADRVRAELHTLPVADRVAKLISEAGTFICPVDGTEHPFLPHRPEPEGAPGSAHCYVCGESYPIAATPEADVSAPAAVVDPLEG